MTSYRIQVILWTLFELLTALGTTWALHGHYLGTIWALLGHYSTPIRDFLWTTWGSLWKNYVTTWWLLSYNWENVPLPYGHFGLEIDYSIILCVFCSVSLRVHSVFARISKGRQRSVMLISDKAVTRIGALLVKYHWKTRILCIISSHLMSTQWGLDEFFLVKAQITHGIWVCSSTITLFAS